ncbi:hypothetical protein Mapa_000593 [Marchantia paleacea]|nr:hypothetical protein Mapa_000593 [Marchantia paleacea]
MERMDRRVMFGQQRVALPYPSIEYQHRHYQIVPCLQASPYEISPLAPRLPIAGPPRPYLYERQQVQYDQHGHLQEVERHERQMEMDRQWAEQLARMNEAPAEDFKSHPVPLARIKRIMRADADVNMIAAETPVLFARACEMFINDLTERCWKNAEESGRRTLNKSDIFKVVNGTKILDFLDDIVPLDGASGSKLEQERMEEPAVVAFPMP